MGHLYSDAIFVIWLDTVCVRGVFCALGSRIHVLSNIGRVHFFLFALIVSVRMYNSGCSWN